MALVIEGNILMFYTSDIVATWVILSSKLDICFPLAYPSAIYKHFP